MKCCFSGKFYLVLKIFRYFSLKSTQERLIMKTHYEVIFFLCSIELKEQFIQKLIVIYSIYVNTNPIFFIIWHRAAWKFSFITFFFLFYVMMRPHQMLRLIFKCGIWQSVWSESSLHPCCFIETFWGRSLCFFEVPWFPVPCFYYHETLRKNCAQQSKILPAYCTDDCLDNQSLLSHQFSI